MSTLTVESALDFLREQFMQQQRQAVNAETNTEAPAPPVIGNEPLLREVLEYITAHPEEHDQSTWGQIKNGRVVGCVGFHAVQLSGDYRLIFEIFDTHRAGQYAKALDSNNNELLISDAAYKALRIDRVTPSGAYRLFIGCETVDDLWQIASELTGGRISRTATGS